MSTELVICKAMRHRMQGELSSVIGQLPVYIYGDNNDASISRVELNASVSFNWAGGAQVFQQRSTSLARVTATLVMEKNALYSLSAGDKGSEMMGRIIAAIRRGVENHWSMRQESQGTSGALRRWYDYYTSAGNITGVTSLPKQTQHEQGEGMQGDIPVFMVSMDWIFYIWTN